METLKESVAYLHGLVEGVNLDVSTKEGRVILGIVDTMGDIAEAMESMDSRQSELEIYVDSLDEELMELEEDVYELDDSDCVEVECPECHETVYFDASILDDEDTIEVTCPNCDAVVFVNNSDYDTGAEDDTECESCHETSDNDILQ